MTPERRQQLEQQALMEKGAKERKLAEDQREPSLDEWLEKHNKKPRKTEPAETVESVHYELPPFLHNIPNLPPSLLPPTAEELQNKPVCEWG